MDQIKNDNWIKIVLIEKIVIKLFMLHADFPGRHSERLARKKKSGICFWYFINDLIASNLFPISWRNLMSSAPQIAEDYKNSRVKKQFATQIDSGEYFSITERRIINHNLELNHRHESYQRKDDTYYINFIFSEKRRWEVSSYITLLLFWCLPAS